jgi:hypothetical protein
MTLDDLMIFLNDLQCSQDRVKDKKVTAGLHLNC